MAQRGTVGAPDRWRRTKQSCASTHLRGAERSRMIGRRFSDALSPALAACLWAGMVFFGPDDASARPGGLGSARRTTLTVGIGNSYGSCGINVEQRIGARISIFVGAGYTPRLSEQQPSGPAGAAGLRLTGGGSTHRLFGQLSVAQIALEEVAPWRPQGRHIYGPGLGVGYQLRSSQGFALSVSAGVGYVLSSSGRSWQPMMDTGIGYSWR